MVRSKRLFTLIDLLSQHHRHTARELAQQLNVSERTIFRDINSLRAEGAEITAHDDGFALGNGWMLSPVKLSVKEIEALTLGVRWVSEHTNAALSMHANQALAKLMAVLPTHQTEQVAANTLLIAPADKNHAQQQDNSAALKNYIDAEEKIRIEYQDVSGQSTERIIWPFALAFYEKVSLLIGWCEMRQDFRHFRTDNILKIEALHLHYPNTRLGLHQLWLQKQIEQHHD